jgi:hypothetical protein
MYNLPDGRHLRVVVIGKVWFEFAADLQKQEQGK